MARFNPYQNSQIADSISGIARALIGNADTDAALARGRASDATAGLRNAQAANEKILGNMRSDLFTKGDALISDPVFQGAVAKFANLDTFPANEFGPPAPGQVQLGGETMSNLARVLLGEYGNAETMSKALGNMVTTGQEVGARNVIMDPSSDRSTVARAMDLLGNTRGKYFDEGLGRYEVNQDNLTTLEKQRITNEGLETTANIAAAADVDVANIAAAADKYGDDAQVDYENYAADRKKEADIKIQELKNTESGKQAAAELQAKIDWEAENNVVKEAGVMVFSPKAAEAYGITNKMTIETKDGPQEVFAIDTRPPSSADPDKVAVILEGVTEPVFFNSNEIKDLPLENVNGVLTWPKGAKAKSGSGSQTANTTLVGENITQAQETALSSDLETKITTALPDLDSGKQMALQTYIIKLIDAKMGKPDSNLAAAKQDIMTPILGGGTHIYRFGKNITVPGYFAQRFDVEYSKYKAEPTPDKLKALQKSVKNTFQNLGYTDEEITRILRNFE